jgi:hypothetical protein
MSLIPRSVNEKNIKDPLKQWYFRQEGMAYRVVPINQKPELPGTRATIERSIMYKNMMEKFWFRNLGPDSDIYLVENIRRMMGNFRNNFVTLASAYMRVADELEQKVKANQVTNRDSARQLVNSYRDSAKAVLDSSAQFISDDVAPIPSYIFAQKGHWYAELSQNDFDTREEALYNLRMGKQRALDEIQYKGGGVSMQDNNVRALNRVMSIYQRTLNMPDKALEIAEILASYAQGRQRRYFQQMIQRLQQQQQRNRQDTARGDTTDTAAAPAGRQAPATPQPQPTPSDLTEPQQ